MKPHKPMPTLIMLVTSALLFTALAYFNRTTLYKNYSYDAKKEPLLTVLMEGMGDRIFPWDSFSLEKMEAAFFPSAEEPSISLDSPVAVSDNTAVPQDMTQTDSTEETADFNPTPTPLYTLGNVDVSYFDDALFIGDSRTVGLHDYATLIHSTYYARVSSTIYEILDDPMISITSSDYPIYGKSTISIREALTHQHYTKIYIMVGINELGTGTVDTFFEEYKEVVKTLQTLQPDALIFVQAIMHVTTEKSQNDKLYNNTNINARNEKIKTLADDQTIFYLDLNSVLDDESGGLNPEYTFDSVHLKASKYVIWENFLLANGAVAEE